VVSTDLVWINLSINKRPPCAVPTGASHTTDSNVQFCGRYGVRSFYGDWDDCLGGFKVWPWEVEEVLSEHNAVREVAVVGVPGTGGIETVLEKSFG
jgi:acyl-CoA synthetase (AMP-forming)/AMP-acid ligase II